MNSCVPDGCVGEAVNDSHKRCLSRHRRRPSCVLTCQPASRAADLIALRSDNAPMKCRLPAAGALLLAMGGCSPALDWRELRPDGAGLMATFPCRPDRHERSVPVAGAPVRMQMLVCGASGATYAVTFFDVAEPAAVTPALAALRRLAVTNIGAEQPAFTPAPVAGMTPNEQAAHLSARGRLPDGAAIEEQAVFFAKGLRVYQASVVGPAISAEGAEPFFSGLRLSTP